MLRSTLHALPDSESRFSERAFRRFEPDLIEVCRHYPKTVTIVPRSMHVESYRARIKDSMRAYVNSDWPSPVDKSRITFILHNYVLVLREGKILVGPRGQTELKSPDSLVNTIDRIEILSIQVDTKDFLELNAAILLSSRGKLPIEVELTNLSQEEAEALEEKHPNISIAIRDEKFYLI